MRRRSVAPGSWALGTKFREDSRVTTVTRVTMPLLLLLVGCATGAEEPIAVLEEAEALPVQIAFQGLCEARTAAEAGDVPGASTIFQSRTHSELHSLADRLSTTDRDAAARLLEAKQRVEDAFADPTTASPTAVAGLISSLKGEVASAAEPLGQERPVCGGAP